MARPAEPLPQQRPPQPVVAEVNYGLPTVESQPTRPPKVVVVVENFGFPAWIDLHGLICMDSFGAIASFSN